MILRPCLLVLDPEHASSLSSRKLVLETAKLNVITAYSCKEAALELDRFPAVDAVVLNGMLMIDPAFPAVVEALHRHPNVRVIVVGDTARTPEGMRLDAHVEGFAPARLLAAVQQMFPEQSRQLQEHDRQLEQQGR